MPNEGCDYAQRIDGSMMRIRQPADGKLCAKFVPVRTTPEYWESRARKTGQKWVLGTRTLSRCCVVHLLQGDPFEVYAQRKFHQEKMEKFLREFVVPCHVSSVEFGLHVHA